jgi:hypothetical protein
MSTAFGKKTAAWLLALMVLGCSSAASVTVAEFVARLFVQLPQPTIYPQVRYQPHAVRGFTLQPSQTAYTKNQTVTINALGFRVTGSPAKTTDAVPVWLALGDSFTFGYGVADQEAWPALLERKHGSVRVVNAGTVSYNLFHEWDLLRERMAEVKPTLVLHGLYWNDHLTNRPPRAGDPPLLTRDGHFVWDGDDNPGEDPLWVQGGRWLKQHSVLVYSGVNQARRYLFPKSSGVHLYDLKYRELLAGELPAEEWTGVEAFYRDLKELGQRTGFEVFVVIMPVRDIVTMRDPVNHPYPKFIRSLLDRQGIRYVDNFAVWKSQKLGAEVFLPHDEHLTAEGYTILTNALVSKLCTGSLTAPNVFTQIGRLEALAVETVPTCLPIPLLRYCAHKH